MVLIILRFVGLLGASAIAALVFSKYAVEEAKRERARLALRAAARRAPRRRERKPSSVEDLKRPPTLFDLESLSVTTDKESRPFLDLLQEQLAMSEMHEKLGLMGLEIQPLSPEKAPLILSLGEIVVESAKREPEYLSEAFVINHRTDDD